MKTNVDSSMCMWGGDRPKSTRFKCTKELLLSMAKDCDGLTNISPIQFSRKEEMQRLNIQRSCTTRLHDGFHHNSCGEAAGACQTAVCAPNTASSSTDQNYLLKSLRHLHLQREQGAGGGAVEPRFNPGSNSGAGSEGGGGRTSTSRTWVQPRFNPGSTQVQPRFNPG